ncbi:hypothetical protein G6F42_014961 [Rhizopus arrhizus]|nr:hypothetical protein G6F42_014961 [Rhizopus arrhizus]
MISAGNSVPEIKKTIDGTDGKSILTYDDIRNWKVEAMSNDKSMDKFGNSASDLIRRMEGRNYIVRYQASSDGKNVKSIFFMHSSAAVEIRVRGEVFGIDATYKVNNKAMPLVSIQTVSHLGGKSLMTTPIAYAAIVSNESAETYTWILEHIKKLTEDKKPVFILDKALFVMKALKTVFPDSVHLLCTWHTTINEKVKSQKDHFGKNDSDPVKYYKAMEYLNSHCWLPIKEKWAGYLVSQTYNFGCKTTSRIEGSHAALKASLLSTRSSLDVCFDEVDKYIKRQLMRFHHAAIEEKVKIDCFVKSEKSMKYLLGQVSAWALDAIIYGEILKINRSNGDNEASQECNQCQNVRYKLSCKHMILNAIKSHGCIPPLNLVDSRWLLDSKKAFVDTGGVDISKEKVAFSKTMYCGGHKSTDVWSIWELYFTDDAIGQLNYCIVYRLKAYILAIYAYTKQ